MAIRLTFVATLVTVTFAPTTTAWAGSETVPRIVPVAWAETTVELAKAKISTVRPEPTWAAEPHANITSARRVQIRIDPPSSVDFSTPELSSVDRIVYHQSGQFNTIVRSHPEIWTKLKRSDSKAV